MCRWTGEPWAYPETHVGIHITWSCCSQAANIVPPINHMFSSQDLDLNQTRKSNYITLREPQGRWLWYNGSEKIELSNWSRFFLSLHNYCFSLLGLHLLGTHNSFFLTCFILEWKIYSLYASQKTITRKHIMYLGLQIIAIWDLASRWIIIWFFDVWYRKNLEEKWNFKTTVTLPPAIT